ncbi:MAG TPA: hypothetical protein VFC19_21110 [Candidatus Limnocylindrales bacterium]|nr:hypothetical protein [Candidatus Limnocylindrales bacterium]
MFAQGIEAAQFGEQDVFHAGPNTGAELGAEADRGVVAGDCGFQGGDGYEFLVAGVVLPAFAEVVEVGATVAFAAHDHESAATGAAPQQALEIVIVTAFAGAASAMENQHALYSVEQFLGDERLVAALDRDSSGWG